MCDKVLPQIIYHHTGYREMTRNRKEEPLKTDNFNNSSRKNKQKQNLSRIFRSVKKFTGPFIKMPHKCELKVALPPRMVTLIDFFNMLILFLIISVSQ